MNFTFTKIWALCIKVFYLIAIILVASLAFIPCDHEFTQGNKSMIVIIHPYLIAMISLGSLACWTLCLIVTVRSLKRRNWTVGLTGLIVTLVVLAILLFCLHSIAVLTVLFLFFLLGITLIPVAIHRAIFSSNRIHYAIIAFLLAVFPISCTKHVISNLVPWNTCDSIVGTDGAIYYFMDCSFLQGQTMAITKLKSQGLIWKTMEVIGTNNGDSPRSWASVIRPALQTRDKYGQLYLSSAGLIVGIRYEHHCYLTYDIPRDRFMGHGDIEELSPFVLIDTNTQMNMPDVNNILAYMKDTYQGEKGFDKRYLTTRAGFPRLETLQTALSHPSAEVKRVAEEMLAIRHDIINKYGTVND